jgi:chromosome partitioning protein
MAYTVAITNQKGGVGKTTTAVNLAAALAIAGRRTLLVDADPQGNTTSGVGIAKLELQISLYDALVDEHPVRDAILSVPGLPYLSVLPATQDLVGAELQLVERPFRESALRRVLEPLESEYDYIIVDCPPSLGLLTLNVLAAVQSLIIPIQCEYYGLEGISQLLNTVRLVQQNINPGLAIAGVLLTMYDSRLNLCRQVAEDATEYFGPKVFGTPIPRNVRLAEAPSFGKPILLYDVQSVGAKSYLAVGQELLLRVEGPNAPVMPTAAALAMQKDAAMPPPPSEVDASTEQETTAVAEVTEATGSSGESPDASNAEPPTADRASDGLGDDTVADEPIAETVVAEVLGVTPVEDQALESTAAPNREQSSPVESSMPPTEQAIDVAAGHDEPATRAPHDEHTDSDTDPSRLPSQPHPEVAT